MKRHLVSSIHPQTSRETNSLLSIAYSSVSDGIKIVEMWRVDSEGTHFHRFNWMSKEGQSSLMEDLENDMTNRMCGTSVPSEEDYLIGKMEFAYGL